MKKNKLKSKIGQFFSKIYSKIKPLISWVASTYVGKIVKGALKFLFSSPIGRLLTITVASLTIAGIIPPLAPALVPIILGGAILSIVVVGITTLMDTIKLKRDKRLTKHASLVAEWQNNEHKKQYLREISPALQESLSVEDSASKNAAPSRPVRYKFEFGKNVGMVLLDGIVKVIDTVVTIMSAIIGVIPLVRALVNGIITTIKFGYSFYTAKKSADKTKFCLEQINDYRGPSYTTVEELELRVKKQQVEINAAIELIRDKDYLQLIKDDTLFKEKLTEYNAASIKLINDKKYQKADSQDKRAMVLAEIEKIRKNPENIPDILANHLQEERPPNRIKEYGESFLNVINPFYNKPKVVKQSSLAKGVEATTELFPESTHLPRKNSVQSVNDLFFQDINPNKITRSRSIDSLNVNLSKDNTHLLKSVDKEFNENSSYQPTFASNAVEDLRRGSSSQLSDSVELRKEVNKSPGVVERQGDQNNLQQGNHVQRVRASKSPQLPGGRVKRRG